MLLKIYETKNALNILINTILVVIILMIMQYNQP